jgi:ACR3 family arsenite transporter
MAAAGTSSLDRVQITETPKMIEDSDADTEKQTPDPSPEKAQSSAFKALGWLDRLLALWILLAMIIGILLGNFAPNTGSALQKGKFVGVSIPIGTSSFLHTFRPNTKLIERQQSACLS